MQEGETTYKANKITLVSVKFSNRYGNFIEHFYFLR